MTEARRGTSRPQAPALFQVACQVLNGEARLPSPSKPRATWRPRSPAVFAVIRELLEATAKEAEKQRQILSARRLWHQAPHSDSPEELQLLKTVVAADLRCRAEEAWRHRDPPRFLPSAREQWGPQPTQEDRENARLIIAGELSFLESLGYLRWILANRRRAELFLDIWDPMPLDAWNLRLTLALAVLFTFAERTKYRIVPCAACPRFFVARTAKAITCSSACRKRWNRANLARRKRTP